MARRRRPDDRPAVRPAEHGHPEVNEEFVDDTRPPNELGDRAEPPRNDSQSRRP